MHISKHIERHKADRIAWLRAAVLGANDGILSTASLIMGVAAANVEKSSILISGVAGLVAGAMSMAAGEYVSVSSQSDTEKADLDRESKELAADPVAEHKELTQIYVQRGLDQALATKVAQQLMAFDPLKSHARDELGITETGEARPGQAALASGITFAVGAVLPLLVVMAAPFDQLTLWVGLCSLLFLVALGAFAAKAGGASAFRGAFRVGFWGAFAMGATALIGSLFGSKVI